MNFQLVADAWLLLLRS